MTDELVPVDDAEVLAAIMQGATVYMVPDDEMADALQDYFWRLAISNPILIFPARCGGKIEATKGYDYENE